METAVFLSNHNQAVRLPRAAVLLEDIKRVEIIAIDRTRTITSVGESWDSWSDGENVSADFIDIRDQPAIQEGESS